MGRTLFVNVIGIGAYSNHFLESFIYLGTFIWTGRGPLVSRRATGWTIWGSNPGGGEIFRTRTEPPVGPTQHSVSTVGNGSLYLGGG